MSTVERGAPVVHVTTVHPRDDIRVFRKECVSLAQAGYTVVQVVGDGKGNAVESGVRIVDIGRSPGGRVARMWSQSRRALAQVRELRPRLVHLHDPELLPLGVALARDCVPVVYDAHEDVPRQILTKQWIPAVWRRPLASAFELYENRSASRLAAVCAATPHIARRFAAVAPISVNVSNFPFLEELAPAAAPRPRERAVCYVGGLTRTRGVLQMVRALAHAPGVRLILCGRFEDAALEAELLAEPNWSRVEFLGQVGRDAVRQVMARSAAGLVTLLPMPSYVDALPIKMFEYMSAELPVVASDFPLWREIVDQAGCGVCVDPQDPRAIGQAMLAFVNDAQRVHAAGQAGRRAVIERYHWPAAEGELLALYERLLGPGQG
ncbi:MAG: glycosyltransferase [Rubrivivax sp.]|nr:glycosyltransferase [Rubrivivax sp.]